MISLSTIIVPQTLRLHHKSDNSKTMTAGQLNHKNNR